MSKLEVKAIEEVLRKPCPVCGEATNTIVEAFVKDKSLLRVNIIQTERHLAEQRRSIRTNGFSPKDKVTEAIMECFCGATLKITLKK